MRPAAFLIGFLFVLGGCTVVGHERVAGWPALEIVEHHVPHRAMRDRCVRYAAPGMSPEACAEFDFAANQCHLWFSADFPPPRAYVEHERLHCQGFDHVGQATMRQAWARYQAYLAALGLGLPRGRTPHPHGEFRKHSGSLTKTYRV